MDKREFYKQLMSQYTFDEDKIRKNSKRRHPRSFLTSKWMPVVSAAAVFIAVFASYNFVPPLLNGDMPVETEEGGTTSSVNTFSVPGPYSVSAGERLADMEYNDYLIKNNIMSALENKVMYISFENSMTPNEYMAVLETYVSDTGEIETLSLWKNSFVEVKDADGNAKYLAAKVNAPVSFYKDLIECPSFSGVDFDNKINDENFEPLSIAEEKERIEETTVTTAVVETTQITTTEVFEEPEPDETEAVDEDNEENADEDFDDEDYEEIIDEEPEPVEGLQEIPIISIPIIGAEDIEFINNDHFIALTSDSISLYRVTDDPDYQLVTSLDASDPKISYINWGTNIMLILDSERTKLFVADGARCELVSIDVSEITTDANIVCAYSGGEDVFIKTVAIDSSYNAFYLAVRNEDNVTLQLIEQMTDKTSVLSFNNESFIYAVTNSDGTTDFRKVNYRNGSVINLDIDIRGELSFVRSHDLTNFAILRKALKKAWIWNAQSERLTTEYETDVISFAEYNSDIFTDGNVWYEFWGSEVKPTTEIEVLDSSIKPMLSSAFTVSEITTGNVKFELTR